MARVPLIVVDFSPLGRQSLDAAGPAELGFEGTWFAIATGAPTAAPPSPTSLWRHPGDPRLPDDAAPAPWAAALAPHADDVVRVQDAGAVDLVEVVRGPNRVRALWWGSGAAVACARKRLGAAVSAAALGDAVAVLFDAGALRVELIRAHAVDEAVAIELSSVLDPLEYDGRHDVLTVLRPQGVLVLWGRRRACWMRIDDLLAAEAASRIEWQVTWCYPDSDPAARLTGTVTMCRYGATNVQLPGRKIQLRGELGAGVGATVTLVGKLWDKLGAVQYREVELPGGRRVPLPGVPATPGTLISQIERIAVVTPEVEVPAELKRQVEALRSEGLLGDMTDDVLGSYLEGINHIDLVELLLRYYEDDELGGARACADRFLIFDGSGAAEVIHALRELVGEPRSTWIGDDARAAETIGDVVSSVNADLVARGHAARIVALDLRYATDFLGFDPGDASWYGAYFAVPAARLARLRAADVPLVDPEG